MDAGTAFSLVKTSAIIIALMIAIIGHEIMHGYVAYKYGDNTAKYQGRLSINPIVHIDPVGSILVPLILFMANSPFLFGWAKPVPVNISTVVRNGGYKAAIAVSLAGVTYNLFMALLSSLILSFVAIPGDIGYFLVGILYYLVVYNVVLAVFNLWPIPPLDGANALAYLGLSLGSYELARFYEKIERFGMIFLLIVLATPLSSVFFLPAQMLLSMLL